MDFAEAYRVHQDTVRAVLARRVPRWELEDVCSDVWLRACANWPRWVDDGRGPGPWLVRIATGIAADCRKSARVRYGARLDATRELEERPDLDRAVDPLDVALLAETRRELAVAMAGLTDAQQQVLSLRYLSELSEADTAQALGVGPRAVRSLAHRARGALRRGREA